MQKVNSSVYMHNNSSLIQFYRNKSYPSRFQKRTLIESVLIIIIRENERLSSKDTIIKSRNSN